MSHTKIFDLIKENNIQFVEFRFTDTKGKWQHTSYFAEAVGEEELEIGVMFDGSAVEGWKAIDESDMILKPDLNSDFIDPFAAQPTLILFCDIIEPSTKLRPLRSI